MMKKENNIFVNINDFLLLVFIFCEHKQNFSQRFTLNWIDGWWLRGELGVHFIKEWKKKHKVTVPLLPLCSPLYLTLFFHRLTDTETRWWAIQINKIPRFKRIFDGAVKQRFKLGILLLFIWCISVIKIWYGANLSQRVLCACPSIHRKICLISFVFTLICYKKKPRLILFT